jgi:hypothetical protein
VLIVHESGMALPVITLPAVGEASLSVNVKRCVLDMFEDDNAALVFEMDFRHPLFVAAQETRSDHWSSLRAAVNDDFMIGQNFAVVEGFLLSAKQDERPYVSLCILAAAIEPSCFFHVVGFTKNVEVQVDRSFVEEVHDSGPMDPQTAFDR